MGQDLSKAAEQLEGGVVMQQLWGLAGMEVCSDVSDKEELPAEWRGRAAARPVIVFDWDDTLLCSTCVRQSTSTPRGLRELEDAVISILTHAMNLGETLIVTNGVATWVQDSARRYLPRTLPTLAKLQVVSARAMCERRYPDDPYMWKEAAFEQLLTRDRRAAPGAGLNIVAIGDQLPEIEAAHHVAGLLGQPTLAKTVKLQEHPSVQELLGQLGHLERELGALVADEATGHRCLEPAPRQGASQAFGWRLSAREPRPPGGMRKAVRSISAAGFWPLFA